MQFSLRRNTLLIFLAAILVITGCQGVSSNSGNPNPGTPGSSNPGNPGGGGGGNPQSASTFVYLGNNTFFPSPSVFPFRMNPDGTLTATSSIPFTAPRLVSGSSGKFLVGGNGPNLSVTTYTVDPKSGIPQNAVSSSSGNTGLVVGSNVFAGANGNGLNVFSISSGGQLSLVPGSPFDPVNGSFFEKTYLHIHVANSLLFGSFNTVKDSGDVGVFSIGSNGALTRKTDVGFGENPADFDVHPSGRFIYEVCCWDAVDVFSFDSGSGSSTLVQKVPVTDPNGSLVVMGPSGRFLLVRDNGIRVFSIDQASGMLTEISGSPFLAADNSILSFAFDPTGRFLLVMRKNSVTVMNFNAASGTLTSGPSYAVGDNLQTMAFATF
jgi:6-phosphogluconolactonase (cycloisomerase 2 family)